MRAVLLAGGGDIEARSVIVASGVSYRRLDAEGADQLTGRGVFYGANAGDAPQVEGDEVYVVGAANSAGQAALNLARHAKRVVMVVRGPDLAASMSQLPRRADPRPPRHRGALPHGRHLRARRRSTSRRWCCRTATPVRARRCRPGGCSSSSAPSRAPTGWATRSPAPRRASWSPAPTSRTTTRRPAVAAGPLAVRPGDERAGRLRGRRRAARLDEAGRLGRRRGRDGGLPRAPLPGGDLMTAHAGGAARRAAGDGPLPRPHRRAARPSSSPGAEVVAIEPGVEAFREGEPADAWWVAGRRHARAGAARRQGGHRRRPDGRARPVGRRVPGVGRPRLLPRHRPRGRRRPPAAGAGGDARAAGCRSGSRSRCT